MEVSAGAPANGPATGDAAVQPFQAESLSQRWSGKRALILGLAREGASLARFLAEHGALVTVTDSASAQSLSERTRTLDGLPIDLVLGGDHPELATHADMLFVSPGVPESNPVYQAATDRGLSPQSMTTLFFDLCPGTIVGITGSSGKTTTTGLIGHLLGHAKRDIVVGGNIGCPMLDLLPRIRAQTTVVLELSSFQLSILRRSPHLAVVTNITPNHLDRHGTMAEYIAAKRHIVQYQRETDVVVLNAGDADSAAFAGYTPAARHWFGFAGSFSNGATVRGGWVGAVRSGCFTEVMRVADIPLPGRHNVENVLAAVATGSLCGLQPDSMAGAVATYRPAPHRLQTIAERLGVRYVDDSIATSPARAQVALEAMSSPVILIAGGRDKRLPWEEFAGLVARKARALLLLGEAAPTIEEAVRRSASGPRHTLETALIRRCASLQEAVQLASRLAHPGDVVLLSPGCASYDMFRDYEERGAAFAQAVEELDAA